MSGIRVTAGSVTAQSLANLQTALSRYSDAQSQASSGLRLSKPSDGPADTAAAMSTRSTLARLAQYSKNSDSGTTLLNAADSALQSTVTQLDRARDIVVQALNTGTGADTTAGAAEVTALRGTVLGLANTAVDGTPVFAGASGTTQAYAADGTYQGDAHALTRQVGAGQSVAVTVPGTTAFGAPGSDVLSVLGSVASKLSSGTVSQSDLDAIDASLKTVSAALTTVGANTNALSAAKDAATTSTSSLTSKLSDLEEVDAPTALINLQTQQVAYQSALAATGKILQSSLLDFLK